MEIVYKLPLCLARKIFIHFRHPVAQVFINYWRPPPFANLLKDIRDYPASKRKLYQLPFAKDHDGVWGRARLLNSLWREAHYNCGNYYNIWKRMYRIRCIKTAKWWIGWRYAVNCHVFQINSLWALFTIEERNAYLQKHV